MLFKQIDLQVYWFYYCIYLLLPTKVLAAPDEKFCVFSTVSLERPSKKQSAVSEHGTISIGYDDTVFECKDCGPFKTLVRSHLEKPHRFDRFKLGCRSKCNGLLCRANSSCIQAHALQRSDLMKCQRDSRAHVPRVSENEQPSENQVPLIIGFAIGGVMLAVVIGGVFLGRSRSADHLGSNEVMTTPVSMTYSEWMSNQTVGRRGSNLRVQEEKDELEVNSPVPVYNIVYTECTSDRGATPETDHGPVVIEVDDDADVLKLQLPSNSSWNDMTGSSYADNSNFAGASTFAVERSSCFANTTTSTEMANGNCANSSLWTHDQPTQQLGDSVNERTKILSDDSSLDGMTFSSIPNGHVRMSQHNGNEKGSKVANMSATGHESVFADDDCWSDDTDDESAKLRQATPPRSFRHNYGSPSEKVLVSLPVSPDGHVVKAENLTHVFVDVHRDMSCSVENVTQTTLHDKQSTAPNSYAFTRAAKKSFRTPINAPLEKAPKRPSEIPMTDLGRTAWQQRARLSSSASGEYAIPFGSLRY